MTTANAQSLIHSLEEMIITCHSIETLLDDDKNLFIKHNFHQVDENNQRKIRLLERLNQLINEMNIPHTSETNFLDSIDQMAAHFAIDNRSKIQNLIHDLKLALTQCYQHLAVNSKIIFTNIKQFNELSEKLFTLRDASCVYDCKGISK